MDIPPVVILDNFPPVHRIKFMQGSGARPGRCIVAAGNDGDLRIFMLPRDTRLRIWHQDSGFAGFWMNMRVVKAPRARGCHVRVVLEDSRWHLTQHTMSNNYNERNVAGKIRQDNQKTIEELLTEIANAADNKLVFSVGKVPDFKPPAAWAGKTCAEALDDLLRNTGCRAVYAPETGQYVVGLPDGSIPYVPDQVFQPSPPPSIRNVYFHSHPKIFETELDVTAVAVSTSTGGFIELQSGDSPILTDDSGGGDPQTNFRLWKADDANKVITPFRPVGLLSDPYNPMREKGRISRDSFKRFPYHQPFVRSGETIVDTLQDTNGGVVFVTEHPVLVANGNNYDVEAKLITGYYKKDAEDGKLVRETKMKTIDSSANNDLHIYVDWIRPVQSDQDDAQTSEWDTLFDTVVEALYAKFTGRAATVSNPYPLKLNGVASVGEVEYDFKISETNSRHNFRVAFNFSPGSEGEIR